MASRMKNRLQWTRMMLLIGSVSIWGFAAGGCSLLGNDDEATSVKDTSDKPSPGTTLSPAAAPTSSMPEKEAYALKKSGKYVVEAPSSDAVEEDSVSVEGVPDLDVTVGPNLSDKQRETSQNLHSEAVKKYRKSDYDGARPLFIKALQANPSNLLFRYNLACVESLSKNTDRALALLRQFKETPDCPRCFIMLAQAASDEDFSAIRDEPRFKALVEGAPEQLKAALKAARWITFDTKRIALPIQTNGLPAISDDGKRVIVADRFGDKGYRLQMILVSSGEVVNSIPILNRNELDQLASGELTTAQVKPRVMQRIDKAHELLLGCTWVPFTIQTENIAPVWLRGQSRQQFSIGNSTVEYDYPNLKVTNSKGRVTVEQKLGSFPDDDCTRVVAISKGWVNGIHHAMLFYVHHSARSRSCTPAHGKYYVIPYGI